MSSPLEPARPLRWRPLLVVLACVALAWGISWGERIPVAGGQGWDGVRYVEMVQQVGGGRFEELSGYHLGRTFPALLFHLAYRSLGIAPSPEGVIRAFQGWTVLVLILTGGLWVLLARRRGLGRGGAGWLFVSLFLTYPVLRLYPYYPCLLDATAFALGSLQLLLALRGNAHSLLLVSVLGAFTWPTLLLSGLLLYVFPPPQALDGAEVRGVDEGVSRAAWKSAGLVAVGGAGLALFYGYWRKHLLGSGSAQLDKTWLPLSALLLAGYLWLGAAPLLRGSLESPRRALGALAGALRGGGWKRWLVAGGVFLALKVAVWALSADNPGGYQASGYARDLLTLSCVRPLSFLVAHVAYFGPVVVLGVLFWRRVSAEARRHGLGVTLVLGFGFALGVDSESRHLVGLLPVFVYCLAPTFESPACGGRGRLLVFAALALALSKAYLPLPSDPGAFEGSFLAFPAQWYFLHLGPWMSTQSYLAQAAVALAVLGLLGWILRARPARPARPARLGDLAAKATQGDEAPGPRLES